MTSGTAAARPEFLDRARRLYIGGEFAEELATTEVPDNSMHSGFGRELGEEALEPYLQSKSIWLDLEAAVPQSGQGISR